jgi:hypothetical protein
MCPALWLQSKHRRTDGLIGPLSSSSVVSDPNTLWTCVTVMSLVREDTLAAISAVSACPARVTAYGTTAMFRPKRASTCRRCIQG